MALLFGRLIFDCAPDIDQVIGDHPEADPALHAIVAAITTSIEAMSPLAYTDASFASRAPSLPVAEPWLLLFTFAGGVLAVVIWDADPLHALRSRGGFVFRRGEAGVRGNEPGNAA